MTRNDFARTTGRALARVVRSALLLAAASPLAARPAAALTWGPETNLSSTPTDSETGLNHRSMTIGPDGALHVVWAERDGANDQYQIRTRRLVGGGWTPGETIVPWLPEDPGESGDDIGAKYPTLATAADGTLHLFWHDYRVAGILNVEIYTKSLAPGGTWDPSRVADVRLTTTDHPGNPGDNGYVPTALADDTGSVHVLWYDYRYDDASAEILSKTRPPGGAWDLTPGDDADDRVTTDAAHSELVAADVASNGDVHAAWRSVDGGAHVFAAVRSAATGLWSSPDTVDTAAMVQGAPALAVAVDGTVHVVWPDGRAGGRALWTNVRDTAGEWGTESQITPPGEAADEPSLAATADGTLHLVWSDGRESLFNREIFHRAKSPGASWDASGGGDTRVSVATYTSSRPSVLVHDGGVSVLWRDDRDGQQEIYFRRGGPPGTAAPDAPRPAVDRWRAFPNPVRSGSVALVGPPPAPGARVRVIDAAGRRCASLIVSTAGAVWDLRDDRGRRVPSGVYFLRPDGARRSARVTVIR